VVNAKAERTKSQLRESLKRIADEGGFDPETYAPLTPAEAFLNYLQARHLQWHTYTFRELTAVLFLFIREKNPSCSLSSFSGYVGLNPSTVCGIIKRLGLLTCTEN